MSRPLPASRVPSRGRRTADQRGLTGAGVAVVQAVLALIGVGLSLAFESAPGQDWAGVVFGVALALAALLTAAAAHREDLFATVVALPLVYAVAMALHAVATLDGLSWPYVFAYQMIANAPLLLAAFVVAVVVALLRAMGARGGPSNLPRQGSGNRRAAPTLNRERVPRR